MVRYPYLPPDCNEAQHRRRHGSRTGGRPGRRLIGSNATHEGPLLRYGERGAGGRGGVGSPPFARRNIIDW